MGLSGDDFPQTKNPLMLVFGFWQGSASRRSTGDWKLSRFVCVAQIRKETAVSSPNQQKDF
jgi:hypothetical protein